MRCSVGRAAVGPPLSSKCSVRRCVCGARGCIGYSACLFGIPWGAIRACLQVLPASSVSASICLQPLAGSAIAATWLQERLSGWDAGAILILAGLAMVLLDTDGAAAAAAAARPRRSSEGLSEMGAPRDGQGSFISLAGSSFMSATLSVPGGSPPQLSAARLLRLVAAVNRPWSVQPMQMPRPHLHQERHQKQ